MKKDIRIVVVAFVAIFLAAHIAGSGALQDQPGPKASTPILVTSCGQSEGPSMLNTILKRVGVVYDIVPLATGNDLKAKGYKTLIITMGASLKGMGAAGISIDDELKRISELIDAARKAKIAIIGAHIEGMKRRRAEREAWEREARASAFSAGTRSASARPRCDPASFSAGLS